MRWNNWKDSLVKYLRKSSIYWGGEKERQNSKLTKIQSILCKRYGIGDLEYLDFVLALAESRKKIPPKLYISNIGGCGSHWLSRMIEESIGWFDIGEVYLPTDFYHAIRQSNNIDQAAKFYDSIEMLHGFLHRLDVKDIVQANLINSAHSASRIPFHRKLFPKSKIVHLIRDPRDRTLSVTFRKNEWREYAHPDKDDMKYLIHNSKRTNHHWYSYSTQSEKADLEIKYEDIITSTVDALDRICNLLAITVPKRHLSFVAEKFSSKNLAKTKDSELIGNLYRGKGRRTWNEIENSRQLRIMHSIMKPAIKGFDYQDHDCFGWEFDYSTHMKLSRELISILLTNADHVQVWEKNEGWVRPKTSHFKRSRKIKGLRVDAEGLAEENLLRILERFHISVLCLVGTEINQLEKVFNQTDMVNVDYVDASNVQGLKQEWLSKIHGLKGINLSGTDITLADPTIKVYCDY